MLSRDQELKLLHVEQWLRALPPEEGLAHLARVEKALRSSNRPVAKNFVQVIGAAPPHVAPQAVVAAFRLRRPNSNPPGRSFISSSLCWPAGLSFLWRNLRHILARSTPT